ncbi:hypothetical protein AB0D04_42235, partial [Streptomyces sp. NPDC048483]|uniref:hypothetical protein n=1 Tax=Streptomyces sp. NPDC048483 TaxID=3154927 RepID=UPI003441500A
RSRCHPAQPRPAVDQPGSSGGGPSRTRPRSGCGTDGPAPPLAAGGHFKEAACGEDRCTRAATAADAGGYGLPSPIATVTTA